MVRTSYCWHPRDQVSVEQFNSWQNLVWFSPTNYKSILSWLRPVIKLCLMSPDRLIKIVPIQNILLAIMKLCFYYFLFSDLVIVILLSFPSRKTHFILGMFPVKQRTIEFEMNRNKFAFFLKKLKIFFFLNYNKFIKKKHDLRYCGWSYGLPRWLCKIIDFKMFEPYRCCLTHGF